MDEMEVLSWKAIVDHSKPLGLAIGLRKIFRGAAEWGLPTVDAPPDKEFADQLAFFVRNQLLVDLVDSFAQSLIFHEVQVPDVVLAMSDEFRAIERGKWLTDAQRRNLLDIAEKVLKPMIARLDVLEVKEANTPTEQPAAIAASKRTYKMKESTRLLVAFVDELVPGITIDEAIDKALKRKDWKGKSRENLRRLYTRNRTK